MELGLEWDPQDQGPFKMTYDLFCHVRSLALQSSCYAKLFCLMNLIGSAAKHTTFIAVRICNSWRNMVKHVLNLGSSTLFNQDFGIIKLHRLLPLLPCEGWIFSHDPSRRRTWLATTSWTWSCSPSWEKKHGAVMMSQRTPLWSIRNTGCDPDMNLTVRLLFYSPAAVSQALTQCLHMDARLSQ